MSIKVTRIKLWETPTLKAFVDVSFSDQITVKNCKVIDGKKGLFVSLPSEPGEEEGKWFPLVKANSNEVLEQVKEVVLAAYQNEVSKVASV